MWLCQYMTSCDPWPCITWVLRSSKVTWGHWPRLTSQWPITNRHICLVGFPEELNPDMWFIVDKNVSKPLIPQPLGQSSSLDQFEFWSLRRWQPARAMPFYLGALLILHVVTGYSNNTLSCSKLNGEHAGECFRSIRHILMSLWACKAKKCFSRKFYFWPDLTRSNVDLGLKTTCAFARSHRDASTVLFCEALRPSGADRQEGRTTPPPLRWRRWRNTENGRGLSRSWLTLLTHMMCMCSSDFDNTSPS